MFKNYLRIAFRHLWQHKLYTAINAGGLAIGIIAVLLAVLYLKDEQTFDRFHTHNPHLYRITTSVTREPGGQAETSAGTGQVQGPAFKAEVPEIQAFTRVMGGDIYGDFIGNDKALHQQILFVDESFLNVFSFPLLRGHATALSETGTVVITENTARKFFNSIDVIGRQLEMDADPSAQKLGRPLVIGGVVQNPPRNSSIQFDVLLPFSFLQLSFNDNNWLNTYLGTFVVLRRDAQPDAVTRKFDRIHASLAGHQLAETKEREGFAPQINYGLQRMTDIHLQPLYGREGNREGGVINGSNPLYSYIFSGIAAFILLMAGINFVNISIAGSLRRAKEVGVRKINGGSGIQIVLQFMLESAMLCFIAFILAAVLVPLVLPVFNQLTGKGIILQAALDLRLLFYCLLLMAGIVLLTGIYPAYVIAGFRPVQVLYSRRKLYGRNRLGRSLVVLQFSLAVFLLIATLLFYRQMNYVRTKDLGYDPHQVIRSQIPGNRDTKQVQEQLRIELAKEPGIQHMAFGADLGGTAVVRTGGVAIDAVHKVIDENYLSVLNIRLHEGRNFSGAYPSDKSGSVVVNEAFVKAAGLKNVLGAQLRIDKNMGAQPRTIVGVVKDFHSGSLHERLLPVVMFIHEEHNSGIWIKYEKTRQQQVLLAFEKAYKKVLPNTVFSYNYLSDLNAAAYAQELRWEKIVRIAAALSMLICCLGLFGLAHLSAHQRLKEVGIRKVLGASVAGIAAGMSKDFLKPVVLAFLIASPFAWRVMNAWLQQFAYRVELSWWIFAVAGVFAVLVAFVTVGTQAIKAAMANPLKSLRTE